MASASPMEGNISQWVSQIQEKHGASDSIGSQTPKKQQHSSSSAAELEEEIQRSRAERAKRRSRVPGSAGPLSPLHTGPISVEDNRSAPVPASSGEETLRKLLGDRGATISPPVDKTLDMKPGMSSTSPPKRATTLLDRYGGAMGPTGVAKAGSNESPASLASFIGGKASGPRLGKLAGDGRTTPPEASLVDYTYRRPLPGMASGAGGGSTGLASFLEARASSLDNQLQSRTTSSSKAIPLIETRISALDRPSLTHRASDEQSRPSLTAATTQTDTFTSSRLDRATSPLKTSQIEASKELTPSQAESYTTKAASLAPASVVHSPTSDALSRFGSDSTPQASLAPNTGVSAAFHHTQQNADRLPTASLTRLRSKKMVEQRVREAQEKGNAEHSPTASPAVRSPPAWSSAATEGKDYISTGQGSGLKARWPNAEASSSPSAAATDRKAFSPTRFGNALPGMGKPQTGPTRNLYAVNNRDPAEEASGIHATPIRLPGMGSSTSPFAAKSAAEGNAEVQAGPTQPLEQLAKGRVKPKRSARPSDKAENSSAPSAGASESGRVSESVVADGSSNIGQGFTNTGRPASPVKSHQPLSVDTDVAPVPTRQESVPIPDSAERRIADSTAALEALLEGETVRTPVLERSKMNFSPEKTKRTGALKIAKNRDNPVKLDISALLKPVRASSNPKTLSLQVVTIKADGSTETLRGEDSKVLYETETQIIMHQCREGDAAMTRVYARTGRLSKLLTNPGSVEARKVQEIGRQNRSDIIDARQGRESEELVRAMGGVLVTREGSRDSADGESSCLYDVRGGPGAVYIDQVDLLASSLCSAHSAIVILQGNAFVWHGKGSTPPLRQSAVRYAQQRQKEGGSRSSKILEYDEGEEDELFWACFDRSVRYANAWHHQFRKLLPAAELSPRLFSMQGSGSTKHLVEHSAFSLLDVRRDGIHLLQLPLELYILIGPDARARRSEIRACLDAATSLTRDMAARRGSTMMTAPVHVVVFPTLPPRELRAAFRYWHDEHLNGKSWQRARLRMNAWERREALEQLSYNEFPLWQLEDDRTLPIGVGREDVQGIDV